MKKGFIRALAISAASIVVCSCLNACFLKDLTSGCSGSQTPAPMQTPITVETSVPEAPETPEMTIVPMTPQPTEAVLTDVPTQPPTPEPGDSVSLGTADMPARFTMPTELYGVSRAEAEAWFADAVFIGDSITIGWKNYNNVMLKDDPSFFGETHFLCEGSYGAGHALDKIGETSLHPTYAGEQHYVWDSASMMGAKKIFFLFGMNDISIYGLDGTVDNFAAVIDRTRESIPDAKIFIISAMYMYKGSEKPKLNNANLYLLNQRLVELCETKDCEFLNIASHLIDEQGFVPDEYSSDKYVHQTNAAYAVWADILRSTAARHIKGLPQLTFSLPR